MTEVPNVYFAAVILEVKQSELRVFFLIYLGKKVVTAAGTFSSVN